jgi:hypothetical protein
MDPSGAFTTADALSAGWTRYGIRLAPWKQLTKGAWVTQSRWDAMDDRAQHLCLVQAALLTRGPGWQAARRSAAVAHDLPLLGRLPTVPQLARQPLRRTDRSSSRHHRLSTLPPEHTTVQRGLAVTSLARTVVDLAREESMESAVVVADAALRVGLSREELLAVAETCRSWPGGTRGLAVARFADGLAESPHESRSRVSIHRCGLPAPELQVAVWLGDLFLGIVDMLWRRFNLVGEADGRLKYTSPAVFYAEKIREERLVDAGLAVTRWSWADGANRNGELDRKIRSGLDRGFRQALDPRVRFVPTTVEQSVLRAARFRSAA